MNLLHDYEWPGNIRELEHAVEHMHIFSEGKVITEEDVTNYAEDSADLNRFRTDRKADATVLCRGIMPLKEAKHEVERQLVMKAYEQCGST